MRSLGGRRRAGPEAILAHIISVLPAADHHVVRIAHSVGAESLGGSAEVLEELEGHLRDEIGRLVQAGQPAEQAFDAAVTRLGSPQALAAEFARLAPTVSWLPVRLAFVVFIAAAGCRPAS